jgi:hypothetical protein
VYREWGKGNVFRGNALSFPATIDGYGFMIQGTNTVSCGNRVRGAAAGLANVACQDSSSSPGKRSPKRLTRSGTVVGSISTA